MKLPRHEASLTLTHNEHRDYYKSATEYIEEQELLNQGELDWAASGQREKAIETDSIWCLHWYPHTPIGFHALWAADLDVLLEAAAKLDMEIWDTST